MAWLVPAIHVFLVRSGKAVDARHKAGHDEPILKRAVGFSDLSSRRTARHGVLVLFGLRVRIPHPRFRRHWPLVFCGASPQATSNVGIFLIFSPSSCCA